MLQHRDMKAGYAAPLDVEVLSMGAALKAGNRNFSHAPTQISWLDRAERDDSGGIELFAAGNTGLLQRRSIAIIGTRKATRLGASRAARFSREIVQAGVVVVSGLAAGIDTVALETALANGGDVIAVIGTPLDRAYPAANAALQERIYRKHLLISQFPTGTRTFPSHFPERNRTMAAISDASVIIEASETSGTLHQAAECMKLGRWLGITRSVAEDPRLSWPAKFLQYERCAIIENTDDFLGRVYGRSV